MFVPYDNTLNTCECEEGESGAFASFVERKK